MSKKKVKLIAMTAGIFSGLTLSLLTSISLFTGYGIYFLTIVESLYIGYEISPAGILVGFIYGFLDAYIGVYLFYMLYKYLQKVVK